jgi:hypothetical protein
LSNPKGGEKKKKNKRACHSQLIFPVAAATIHHYRYNAHKTTHTSMDSFHVNITAHTNDAQLTVSHSFFQFRYNEDFALLGGLLSSSSAGEYPNNTFSKQTIAFRPK